MIDKAKLLEWLIENKKEAFYGKEKHTLHVVEGAVLSGLFDITPMKDEELQGLMNREWSSEDYEKVRKLLGEVQQLESAVAYWRETWEQERDLARGQKDNLCQEVQRQKAATEAMFQNREKWREDHGLLVIENESLRQEVQRLKVRIAELEDERGDYFDQP